MRIDPALNTVQQVFKRSFEFLFQKVRPISLAFFLPLRWVAGCLRWGGANAGIVLMHICCISIPCAFVVQGWRFWGRVVSGGGWWYGVVSFWHTTTQISLGAYGLQLEGGGGGGLFANW